MNINCRASACAVLFFVSVSFVRAQSTAPPPPQSSFPKEAYVFELLQTRVKFDADGKGFRDVTSRVRIQSEAATHEFGLLRFPYASSFESLDIDYIRVRKPDGTVISTPASDIQDLDSEVSRQAPMYTDEREKHVAIKSLTVGDILESHVVWTIHDPVAPGHFWLDDNYFRGGICLDEELEFDVPRDLPVKFVSGSVAPVITESGARRVYRLSTKNLVVESGDDKAPAWEKGAGTATPPEVQLSSFQSWDEVGKWFGGLQASQIKVTPQIQAKAEELTKGKTTDADKIRALYDFVSLRFRYIGISLGQGRYASHRAEEVLANRYGDCKDKHTLFTALLAAVGIKAYPVLISSSSSIDSAIASPSLLDHVITAIPQGDSFLFVDTTPEIAAFGYLLPSLRDKSALVIATGAAARLVKTPATLPMENSSKFQIDASLDSEGTLDGKARWEASGDTEAVIRSVFRATSESQWKQLTQGIVGAFGFGGTVSDVSAAQPEFTGEPFWFSYSYHRPEFSDWKNHRISLPMPPMTLPGLSEKRKAVKDPLVLGFPVEITYHAKIKIPKGMSVIMPPAVDLKREFAGYEASYSFADGILTGTRHLKLLMKEIPGSQRAAYSEFVDSLLEDQNRSIPVLTSSAGLASLLSNVSPDLVGPRGHSDNERAQQLYDEARESLQLGAPRAAISSLENAVKLEPKWADAWLLLGNAHMMASQPDPAIDAYRKAIAFDQSNAQTYRILARALTVRQRDAEAAQVWRELLKVTPDDPQAASSLRLLLLREGNYAEALPLIQKAAEQNSEAAAVQFQFGEALLHLDSDEQSMSHFRKAIDLDSSADMLNSVAYTLAEANRHLGDALHYAQMAVQKTEEETANTRWENTAVIYGRIMGDLAAQWDTLGWVQFHLADYKSAVKYLDSAWLLMQAPVIGDHLADTYKKLGKNQEATRTYAMALSALGPNGDSKLRHSITAKMASLSTAGASLPKDATSALMALRTYKVPTFKDWGGGYKSAQFTIVLTKGPTVDSVSYRSGADELEDANGEISDLDFRVSFPDDGPTRIILNATFSCSEISKGCTLVILPLSQPLSSSQIALQ